MLLHAFLQSSYGFVDYFDRRSAALAILTLNSRNLYVYVFFFSLCSFLLIFVSLCDNNDIVLIVYLFQVWSAN